MFEQDLFGKPVSTFPDHALGNRNLFQAEKVVVCGAHVRLKSSAVTVIGLMLMISVLIAIGALHTAREPRRRGD